MVVLLGQYRDWGGGSNVLHPAIIPGNIYTISDNVEFHFVLWIHLGHLDNVKNLNGVNIKYNFLDFYNLENLIVLTIMEEFIFYWIKVNLTEIGTRIWDSVWKQGKKFYYIWLISAVNLKF